MAEFICSYFEMSFTQFEENFTKCIEQDLPN